MSVLVKLSTSLRRHVPGYQAMPGLEMEDAAGLSLGELIAKLGIPEKEVRVTMINGRHSPWETIINDGDRVGIFPAVGGG